MAKCLASFLLFRVQPRLFIKQRASSIEIQKLMVRIADFYKLCNVTQVNHANFMVRVGLNVVIEQKRKFLV
jgi:hypothetical protein